MWNRYLKLIVVCGACGLLFCFGHVQAAGTTTDLRSAVPLAIGEVVIVDDAVTKKGISVTTVSAALRLLAAGDPTIQLIAPEPDGTSKKPRNGFYLSSSLQSFQDSILWTGTLQRFRSQDESSPPREDNPVKLGPVTLVDSSGLKPLAFAEIGTLIKRQLNEEPVPAQSLVTYRISCLSTDRPKSKRFAEQLAYELDLALQGLGKLRSAGVEECKATQDALNPAPQYVAVTVDGRVDTGDDDETTVQPNLVWVPYRGDNPLTLPLPELREGKITPETRRRYLRLLSSGIPSIVNETSRSDLKDASDAMAKAAPEQMVQTGSSLLKAGNSPYLALALLQRGGAADPNANVAYEIGKAYSALDELLWAERYLRDAVKLAQDGSSDLADIQGELGKVLFRRQKFKEAEKQFKASLQRKDNQQLRVVYLQIENLLGNETEINRQLNILLEQSKSNPRYSFNCGTYQVRKP